MTTKYLYLDDEEENVIKPLTDAVSIDGELEIVLQHPGIYNDDFDSLIKVLQDYHGFILDWRLDQTVPEGSRRFKFRAGALAQEIRSREIEKAAVPIPIILWTTHQRFEDFYQRDKTSHDLFDRIYVKDKIAELGTSIGRQLISIHLGYQAILSYIQASLTDFRQLLGCVDNPSFLDIRVQEHFGDSIYPVYDYARFILKELIDHPGPLISENLLAARLGIDVGGSEDWKSLLDIIKDYQYQGPFGDEWQRWWSYGIEEKWWFSLPKVDRPLSALTAAERVEIIKLSTELSNLIEAQPIEDDYQTRFITICEETKMPLDPLDGVIIDEPDPAPWQDRRYLSLKVALERGSEKFRPHPTELERLSEIRRARG